MPGGRPATKPAPRFGSRLAALRVERGLSQSDLARQFDTTRDAIAYYERASKNPSAEFITKAAAFFGVTFDDLLGEVEKPKGKPGPEGKLRQVFDQAAELPRDQQKHIVRLVEDAMTAYRTRQAKTSTAA